MRETICGSMDTRRPIYSPEFWRQRIRDAGTGGDIHKSVWIVDRARWSALQETHRRLLPALLSDCKTILDAGCGYGPLAEVLPGGLDYTGVDLSRDLIELARERCTYPGARFLVGDLRWLFYPDRSFDVAVCRSIDGMVIKEIGQQDWDLMERELLRVAKKLVILSYEKPEEYRIVHAPPLYYMEGQFNVVRDYIQDPAWLLLGGPADGDEAQCARKLWPKIQVVGVDPCPDWKDWQMEHGWPEGAPLLTMALSDKVETAMFKYNKDDMRCCSLLPEKSGVTVDVKTVTWDQLDRRYGPFERAVMWLDVEGWELKALQGAGGLFERGAVDLVNVKLLARIGGNTEAIHAFLTGYGFEMAHRWNVNEGVVEDRIYVRK